MPRARPAADAAPTVAVLLAAGAGSRLGRGPKALLPHRGRTLVEHAVDVLAAGGCDAVVVVLGSGADAVRRAAGLDRPDVRVVVNDDWATGLASSLRCGVAVALAEHPARVVVAHVDQPGVTPDDVARLLAAHRPGRVSASRWAGAHDPDAPRWAHPLVLDAGLAAAAASSAHGDEGARGFLRAHADLVDLAEHPGDGRDVDSPGDLDLLG